MSLDSAIENLASLARRLGSHELAAVVHGEGNVSCRLDRETFAIKASGQSLHRASHDTFIRLRLQPLVDVVEHSDPVSPEQLANAILAARVDADDKRQPSVEVLVHAWCLHLPGVQVVARTHPVSIHQLACSHAWPTAFEGRLFPDEVVVLGPATCLLPYKQPGVMMARELRDGVDRYRGTYGAAPKSICVRNHGLWGLAGSVAEAEAITVMAMKSAAVRAGAWPLGGLNPMTDDDIAALWEQPDQHFRLRILLGDT